MSEREEMDWSHARSVPSRFCPVLPPVNGSLFGPVSLEKILEDEARLILTESDPRVLAVKRVCDRLVTALHEETPLSAASWPRDAREISRRFRAYEERMHIKPSARSEGVAMPFQPETSNPEKILDLRGWDLFVMYGGGVLPLSVPSSAHRIPLYFQRPAKGSSDRTEVRPKACGADVLSFRSMHLSYPPRKYLFIRGSSPSSTRTRIFSRLFWPTKSLM
jgi:hypothetical protein